LIDGDLKFPRGQLVLTLFFVNPSDPDVRLGLETMTLSNGAIECADRFIGLARFAIDTAFDRGSFRVNSPRPARSLDLGQRTFSVVDIEQYSRQSYMRRR